jgi:hypothetical protein
MIPLLNPRERILRFLLRSQRALRLYLRGLKILRSLLRRASICELCNFLLEICNIYRIAQT